MVLLQAAVVTGAIAIAAANSAAATVPTWPSPRWDELEWVVYQDNGYAASRFTEPLVPCSDFNAVTLRMAFHDVAGHLAKEGVRGIDASLRYELNYTENVLSFNEVYFHLTNYHNSRLSISDAEVAHIVAAVALCDGPSIPLRLGRIDATEGNPPDAFRPSHTTDTLPQLIGNFSLMGFNQSEFITLIACAHTLGGVEHDEDPAIVSEEDNKVMFDSTNLVYDFNIVKEYLDGTVQDPLIVGPAATNVDLRIFSSDGNATISKLNSQEKYFDACVVSLQKIMETVPKKSVLSDVLVPYDVKPHGARYDIGDNNVLTFTGEVRVRTTLSNVTSVVLNAKDDGSKIRASAVKGAVATGGYPKETFQFFSFSHSAANKTVSQYSVSVAFSNGTIATFDNNGAFFPIEPRVFHARSLSCVSPQDKLNWTATIVAAVQQELASSPVNLVYTYGVRDPDWYVPGADLFETTIPMKKMANQNATAEGYVLFSAQLSTHSWTQYQATFDIVVGSSTSNVTHAFNKLTDLVGQDCPTNVVELDWEVGYVNVNLKDLGARRMIGVNGVWPPEAIYANTGDTLTINLSNKLDVPTALHFFGIHQTGAPQYDGYPMVNQCPIPAKSNYTYTVLLNQTGTFYIEGSYAGQSVDGLRVPLIVRSTSDPKWDDYVVTLSEWYDEEYSSLFGTFSSTLNPLGVLPKPEAIIVNEVANASVHFNSGEKYMLRLISFASQLSMFVAIDSHNMTIVEVDGFPVEEYEVTALTIAPGQRFGVLVEGMHDQNTTIINYMMHVTQQVGNADADGTEAPVGALSTFLTVSYGPDNPYGDAIDTTESSDAFILYDDSMLRTFVPAKKTEVLKPTRRIVLDAAVQMMADGSARGTFNNTAYIQPKVPSLITALTIGDTLKSDPTVYGVDTIPYVIDDGVTEIVILNQDITNAHSFHLHGHSFQIVDVDNLPFDPSKNFDALPDDNRDDSKRREGTQRKADDDDDDGGAGGDDTASGYPTRDTVQIPPASYAVIRFRNENAGVWLLHSTNTFLRDYGFAATLIVNPDEIPGADDLMDAAYNQTCAAAGVPTRGNAAGNLGSDLSGYIFSPGLPPSGPTAAFWGTIFGCAACVLVMILAVYLFHIPDDVWADRIQAKKND